MMSTLIHIFSGDAKQPTPPLSQLANFTTLKQFTRIAQGMITLKLV